MKVQEVKLDNNQRRYLLLDDNRVPIIPVARYLKYIDNSEKSFNTQKTYAYSLKLYFEYLEEINVDYRTVNINILSNFVFNSKAHCDTRDAGTRISTFFTRPLIIYSFRMSPASIVFPRPTSSARIAFPFIFSITVFATSS